MKKVLLTIGEFTNKQGEVKKNKVKVGRVHQYKDGGEAIILDSALCATLAAMGQKALNAGEDSVWLSIWEEQPKEQAPGYGQQAPQIPQQQFTPQPQQQPQQQQFTPAPMNQQNQDF